MTTTTTLSVGDLEFIKESLQYTKLKFESYTDYPSEEFKKQKVESVANVLAKVSVVLKEMKTK